ncbi:MAG TPA: sigma-70 family RNA polymerase sigma factor [Acidobacteriota bacterium]
MQVASRQKPAVNAPGELEKLFAEHYDLIFRTAYRITGSSMDAEDVLQTLFLRLIRRQHAIDPNAGAGSYLHRAAVNAALDLVRRRNHLRNVRLDDMAAQQLQDSKPHPDRCRSDSELRAWFRSALADLNPRRAEIFALRYLEGYSYLEIARAVGMRRATIAVILHRTRIRLRNEIRSFLGGNA